jgi:hypothetical protein
LAALRFQAALVLVSSLLAKGNAATEMDDPWGIWFGRKEAQKAQKGGG